VPSKQDNIKRGTLRSGANLTHESAVRAIASRLDLVAQAEVIGSRVDFDNSGVPSAVCFDPSGIYAFVALEANRVVAVVDVWNAVEVVRFPTGRAPQGVTISPDGKTLFVENFLERTVTVHDVSAILAGGQLPAPTLATLKPIATEKLPANVLLGKQLFYDASDTRLALEGYLSCASCHNDGDGDGRVWDFTGLGEGLRNTITLRGHGGTAQGPMHWSGNFDEVQDFDNQIRTFAGGTGLITNGTPNPPLGAPNAGRSSDLDALAAYVKSLTVTGPSPARTDAVSYSAAATAGRAVFIAQNCASCHSGTQFTNSALNVFADIGTLNAAAGQRLGGPLTGFDVPTLRGLWATAPYLHDGSAATIAAAVTAHRNVTLGATDLSNLVAYLSSLDDDAAAPGQFGDAGFESPKLGSGYVFNPAGSIWTFSATSGVTTNGSTFTAANYPVPGGSQALFLQAAGTAQQAVTLAAGTYRVRFSAAQRGYYNTAPQTVIVTVDGAEVGRITPATALFATYDTPSFTVAAGARVIRFAGFGKNADGTTATNTTAFLDELQILPTVAPTVNTPVAQSSARGAAASLQIVAKDPNGLALKYSATGLPAGLAINATSGLISGTVSTSAAAANAATVTVSNGALSASASFSWATAAAVNHAPTIAAVAAQSTVRGQSASLQINANDVDGQALTYAASGLPTGLAINAAGLISGTVSLSAAATNSAKVTTSDGSLSASSSFTWTTSAPPALALTGSDIGAPGAAGSNSYAASVYTVSGGGSDIWNSSDQCRYVSQTFVGNGEIIARVTSQTATDAWAKAGVMFRETLNANACFATMELTPGSGLTFQYRAATAGACGYAAAAAAPAPAPNNWLRLVRAGSVFTGYLSTDGVTWTQVGTTTVPMATAITVGLAVTSHNNATLSTATFDNVQLKSNP
jgi:regulation of enolase protein 1 (concanavalin A-like superfamily)/mono/diheme cytochrome c family protein